MKYCCWRLIAKSAKAQRLLAKAESIVGYVVIHDFWVLSGTFLVCTAYICAVALLVSLGVL